jgi:hypothetical protein
MELAKALRIALFVATLALVLLAAAALGEVETEKQHGSEAYVTLLYGDEFLLGVRVLGQSLRDSGTTKCATSVTKNRDVVVKVPKQRQAATGIKLCWLRACYRTMQ